MDSEEIAELRGKYVEITWEDELLGKQEAAGILVEESDDGYLSLDWGCGISKKAKGLTVTVSDD